MKDCLDEGTLQSYFDGELSTRAMESATFHLANCATCSAAARELEQETSLLISALEAEFDVRVPTESLRQRIDAAVAGLDVPTPVIAQPSGLSTWLAGLFSFSPQRALGYAGLIVMLAIAAIFVGVKLNASKNSQTANNRVEPMKGIITPELPNPEVPHFKPAERESVPTQHVAVSRGTRVNRSSEKAPVQQQVKLLPGERSYLQAIARLDTAIKSDKKAMRPALQVEYERNLAVVDRAIAATRTAAKSNPNDPDAADFMFAAYQSKVDLLNTIADARLGDRSH